MRTVQSSALCRAACIREGMLGQGEPVEQGLNSRLCMQQQSLQRYPGLPLTPMLLISSRCWHSILAMAVKLLYHRFEPQLKTQCILARPNLAQGSFFSSWKYSRSLTYSDVFESRKSPWLSAEHYSSIFTHPSTLGHVEAACCMSISAL